MKPLLLLVLAAPGWSQTTVVGDAWITGTLAVGTTAHSGRVHVQGEAADETLFQVSGVDLSPLLAIDKAGKAGVGVAPTQSLDVNGYADLEDIAAEFRNGNLYPSSSLYQITFGQNGSVDRRHAMRSVHLSSTARNSMDFLLWTPASSVSSIGSVPVASLVTTTWGAAVHIRPTSDLPDVQLEVSDGSTTGGGTIHRLSEATHSSRRLKTDIAYFTAQDEARGLEEVAGLRHASYRYNKSRITRRGLIYEEVPDSIRGDGESVVIDRRVANAELGLKEVMRKLEAAEARARRLP